MNYSGRIQQSFARIWFLAFVFASLSIVPILLFEQRVAWIVLIPLVGSVTTFLFYQALADFPKFAQVLRTFFLAIGERRTFGTVTANASLRLPSERVVELLDKQKNFPSSSEAEYFRKLAEDFRIIDIADMSPQAALEFSKLTFTLLNLRAKYLEVLERQGSESRSLKTPIWYEVESEELPMGVKLGIVKKIVGVQTIYLQDLLNLMRAEDQLIEKTAKR